MSTMTMTHAFAQSVANLGTTTTELARLGDLAYSAIMAGASHKFGWDVDLSQDAIEAKLVEMGYAPELAAIAAAYRFF